MLSDIVLVNVHVVAERVESASKDKRRVHETAGVHQLASLLNLKLLHVKHEDSVEHLLRESALASENDDLVLSDLVG